MCYVTGLFNEMPDFHQNIIYYILFYNTTLQIININASQVLKHAFFELLNWFFILHFSLAGIRSAFKVAIFSFISYVQTQMWEFYRERTILANVHFKECNSLIRWNIVAHKNANTHKDELVCRCSKTSPYHYYYVSVDHKHIIFIHLDVKQ